LEEEIDLREYLQVIRRRFWIIALITIAAVLLSAVLSYFYVNPVYEASVTLMVIKKERPIDDYSTILLNRQLVKSYGEIAKSRTVLEAVVGELNLDLSAEELRERVKVSPVPDTEIIKVTVEDTDPTQAMVIANAIAQEFKERVIGIVKADNVEVIDPAVEPTTPVRPRPRLNMAIAAVLGLMSGTFLVFLLEFLDNTIKGPDDVERYLGLPVLGIIPEIRESAAVRPVRPGEERGS